MPKRSVNGIDLAYEVHGAGGDPAVLVHGSLVDRHSSDLVTPGLAQSMEVVVYDRRGCGESGGAPGVHPLRDDASDLAGLLEALNIYPVHVIAHSYGGAVALRLAIDRPEMVRSLSIHEVPFIGLLTDDPATAAEGERLLIEARELVALVRSGETGLAAERLVQVFSTEPGSWSRLPPEVQRSFGRTIGRWAQEFEDPEAWAPDRAACRELMVPALLTFGSESPRFLQRIAADLAAMLQNSQLREMPGVGHAPHLTRPHQYVGLLLAFLLERNVPVS
jgi:pimeloyl-ACP methyl ester carboxylesterase